MGDEPVLSLEALEREEARLRERLAKVIAAKELLLEVASPVGQVWAQASTQLTPPPFTLPHQQPSGLAVLTPPPAYNGTFVGLIERYRQDKRSSYHQLKHGVRVNYDRSLNRLITEIGGERVADWSAQRVKKLYDENWAAGGKIAMGHEMIGKLRLLSSFGSVLLNDDACHRLSAILGNMRFPVSKSTGERLTIDHARAIRAAAREHFGWNSVALAQALQYEFPKLRQTDVIGEWVPLSEPGTSDIVKGNEKWIRGLRWSDIDDDLVLRRVLTSGRRNQQKEVEFNLKRAGMVMEEINRIPPERRTGPMIVCEFSGLPWTGNEFRRKWRKVADKAGIPKNVKSMDARKPDQIAESDDAHAGGIFE